MSAVIVGLLAVLTLFAGVARGGEFPSKAVRIVVPYPISGPPDIRGSSRLTKTYKLIAQHAPPAISDTLARLAAEAIRGDSRHPAVIERVPGGATTRGAVTVARAAPDGHTLLLASNGTIVINPNYFYGIAYQPSRDFELVAPIATMPFVLLVNSGLPAYRVQKLGSWLKVRPGEINYGSSGDGSTGHIAGEFFRRMAGVDVVHVSYNGGLAALNGLATGQVSLMFAALPLALPYLLNEHFRPLGITSAKRFALLPELPTLAESGLAGFEVEAWYGIFAPARSPNAAMVWLNQRIAATIDSPSTADRLLTLGLEATKVPREQFATRIHSEVERWGPLVRASRMPYRGRAS